MTSLLRDLQVSANPLFAWIVPSCTFSPGSTTADSERGQLERDTSQVMAATEQVAYRVVLQEERFRSGSGELDLVTVWDSGQVFRNTSVNVEYNGTAALTEATVYQWHVTTWSSTPAWPRQSAANIAETLCQSLPSHPARFATALTSPQHRSLRFAPPASSAMAHGWSDAQWIWSAPPPTGESHLSASNRFSYLRRVVAVDGASTTCMPQGVHLSQHLHGNASEHTANRGNVSILRALLYVTATIDPTMLSAYKVRIDGTLVAIGPGRGEAYVRDLNPTPSANPYDVADVTTVVR